MKFSWQRKSVVKQTMMDSGIGKYKEIATVQRISAYDETNKPRVDRALILGPTYNRAKRRSGGNIKSRKRIRGQITIARNQQPWYVEYKNRVLDEAQKILAEKGLVHET